MQAHLNIARKNNLIAKKVIWSLRHQPFKNVSFGQEALDVDEKPWPLWVSIYRYRTHSSDKPK